MNRIVFVSLALAASLWGQLDGITVTAYQTVTLPPSEAVFNITVTTDPTKTIEDVLAKVKELGLAAHNLRNVMGSPYGGPPGAVRVTYNFYTTVPLGKVKEFSDAIAQLRRTELEFDIQGFPAGLSAGSAAVEQARKRVLADLLRDARARAEEYASAVQLSVGPVISVSESPSSYVYATLNPDAVVPLTVWFALTVRFKAE